MTFVVTVENWFVTGLNIPTFKGEAAGYTAQTGSSILSPVTRSFVQKWDDFVNEFHGKHVNGYTINCTEVDCSNNDDPQIASVIQEFKINGFPTVQMYVDGNTINFDSAVTKSTLELFVSKML